MVSELASAMGGIGLFLIGMLWLTDGLRGLAGASLRTALARFTNTPLSGAVTGAATTALLQSSSITTVTAVGFVGAGLLSFPQALGVIFGANIGTTMTGWIVALLGFKLDLGQITLPLVFLGALAQLFGNKTLRLSGTAICGFALIFFGIDVMKDSLAAFEGVVTPGDFPGDSLWGRLQMLLIGVAITLITQSSSSGVITALAALGAGAINLPQALAMVIGMDVGTTVTAALATLGGSTAARRTGLSHVIYNLFTGVMAFLLLGPYALLAGPQGLAWDSQFALVAFHSGFNLLGVVVILPFAGPFARMIETLVPAHESALTRGLGKELLRDPGLAVEAALAALRTTLHAQLVLLAERMTPLSSPRTDGAQMQDVAAALTQLRSFLEAIPPIVDDTRAVHRLAIARHVIDHLGRLHFRLTQEPRLAALQRDHRLRRLARILGGAAQDAAATADTAATATRLDRLRRLLRHQRERYRAMVLAAPPAPGLSGAEIALRLDAMRWLHRVSYHLWRLETHMDVLNQGVAPASLHRAAVMEGLSD